MKRFFFLITTILTVVLIMTFKSGSAQSQDNYYPDPFNKDITFPSNA